LVESLLQQKIELISH